MGILGYVEKEAGGKLPGGLVIHWKHKDLQFRGDHLLGLGEKAGYKCAESLLTSAHLGVA